MKITIIGASSGGKSTLARKISTTFDIPRLEIDRIWFSHDGHKFIDGTAEEKEVIQEKVRRDVIEFLNRNESWVSDGTYSKIQPVIADSADMVIIIQRPLGHRMLSHIKRNIQKDGRHPEISRLQDLMFVKTLWRRWWKGENNNLQNFALNYRSKLITLRSFSDIDNYFDSLK